VINMYKGVTPKVLIEIEPLEKRERFQEMTHSNRLWQICVQLLHRKKNYTTKATPTWVMVLMSQRGLRCFKIRIHLYFWGRT
jgi:hypothetical protein